ncbi:PstS family phosphate ABC transporter substrate-binding protein [Cytobacillus sp. Hz8]|uniref:PstS family phosphate ABC transporter substrate-binding protein n=1 Tax=Cytobacillus sp. Hz8 TaxID=3347168 RepID=UPI0035D6D9CF
MKSFKFLALSAVIGASLVLTTACGSDGNSTDKKSAQAGEENKQLQGEINIDGSSTVYPIMEAVVEEYGTQQPGVKVSAAGNGTGNGFKALIDEKTIISDASREIEPEEQAELDKKGIKVTPFKLAFDGISVVVNKENDFVDKLTIDELKKLWIEDGKVKKWSDIRKGWPDKEIKFYSPGTESGTFDYFDEVILEGKPIVEKATLSEDDNILVQGVKGDANGIGYFGYAYYLENKDQLKIVPIDNGEGAVEPTNETIESGKYAPLSRPLYSYVRNDAIKKDEVYDFLKFMLENAADFSEEVGYVKLPEDEYTKDLDTLESLK